MDSSAETGIYITLRKECQQINKYKIRSMYLLGTQRCLSFENRLIVNPSTLLWRSKEVTHKNSDWKTYLLFDFWALHLFRDVEFCGIAITDSS